MARSNDGLGYQIEFGPRMAGQDRKDFPLGTSEARPAPGYWADRAGLSNDQEIKDAIAGLLEHPRKIRATLIKMAGEDFARDYMTYHNLGWKW